MFAHLREESILFDLMALIKGEKLYYSCKQNGAKYTTINKCWYTQHCISVSKMLDNHSSSIQSDHYNGKKFFVYMTNVTVYANC